MKMFIFWGIVGLEKCRKILMYIYLFVCLLVNYSKYGYLGWWLRLCFKLFRVNFFMGK